MTGPETSDIASLTPGAFQRNWRTPTEFPQCPGETQGDALSFYVERLEFGVVFARNRYGDSTVVTAALGDGVLSVLSHSPSGIKDWTVAKIYQENGQFCHESVGMFFSLQGALKVHCEIAGEPFVESIDDYA